MQMKRRMLVIAMLLLRNCKSKNLLKKTLLAQKDAHLKHLIIYGKEKAQQVFKIAYFSVPRIEDPVHLSFITLFLQPVFLSLCRLLDIGVQLPLPPDDLLLLDLHLRQHFAHSSDHH